MSDNERKRKQVKDQLLNEVNHSSQSISAVRACHKRNNYRISLQHKVVAALWWVTHSVDWLQQSVHHKESNYFYTQLIDWPVGLGVRDPDC